MKTILTRLRHAVADDDPEIIPALMAGAFFAAALLHWLME